MSEIQLFPHQTRGVEFLTSSPGTKGLFYGMGTGKTLTALASLKALVEADGAHTRRALVIAPPIALPMWLRTAQDFLGVCDNASAILATGKAAIKPGHKVLVVSYAIAQKRAAELRDWLAGGAQKGVLICDESHALKSVKSKRTKAILGSGGIASGASHSWMLTGTPITRWNDDMYPFMCRADLQGMKKLAGGTSEERFQLRFTVRQERKFPGARWPVQMVVGNRHTDELADWVYNGGHAIRVDLKEVFENMPPITHNRYVIGLDADAALKADLKQLEKASLQDIRNKLQSKEPNLSQLRRRLGLAKAKAAASEIMDRLDSGVPVLVGAWHTDVIDAMRDALVAKKHKVGVIDGRASSAQKDAIVQQWNAGKLDVVLGQIAAMGVSLNLQEGGNRILVVEEDWSPSIMDQFYARLWRYGQQKHVHVDTLTSDTKLDAAVGRISSTKGREHERFNAAGREDS